MIKVGDFLSEMFQGGYEYSTINNFRSAISALHDWENGIPVGQLPLIKRIMSGVFQEKPPQPRYTDTWDVSVVLEHLESLGSNETLSDADLTHKLAMLLALTTASRASEIQGMDLEFMLDKGEEMFTIPKLTKTMRAGQKPHTVTLVQYEKKELDVVSCVRAYVRRTHSWRTTKEKHKLLLSTIPPHKPVATSTIANWLKKVMTAAGIDTDKYKAHSTRSAATSKAKAVGLSVSDIIAQANWSRASTFSRFYDRQTHNNDFAKAVLK